MGGVSFLYFYVLRQYLNNEPIQIGIAEVVDGIINNKYLSIYWFFISLFAIYLCIPVLSKISDKMTTFKYIIIIGILFRGCIPFIFNIVGIHYNNDLTPPVVEGFLIYPCVGYYLANYSFSRKQTSIIYLAGAIGWAIQLLGTLLLSTENTVNQLFKGYTNFPCILYSMAVFLLFKNLNSCFKDRLLKAVNLISNTTFGIYLIHMYISSLIGNVINLNGEPLRRIWAFFGPLVLFVICFFIVFIMKHIPILRRLVP